MLTYVVQKELDTFKDVNWNETRGRKQNEKWLQHGIPTHSYQFPSKHGGHDCGVKVTDKILLEGDDELHVTDEWMTSDLRYACEQLLPRPPENVSPYDANATFIQLKNDYYQLGFEDRV